MFYLYCYFFSFSDCNTEKTHTIFSHESPIDIWIPYSLVYRKMVNIKRRC